MGDSGKVRFGFKIFGAGSRFSPLSVSKVDDGSSW